MPEETPFISVILPLPFFHQRGTGSPVQLRLIDLFATTCPKRLVMFLSSMRL